VWPEEQARKELAKKRNAEKKERAYQALLDTAKTTDKAQLDSIFQADQRRKMWAKYRADHNHVSARHSGKPIAKGEFSRWTDITTPRWDSMVENWFGESIQLHQQNLLEDTLRRRPVIVYYDWLVSYVVEALIVLLFVLGIIFGWRDRFLWLVMSYYGFDLLLHVGLGFGLNEVYIMAAHWAFTIPIAIGCLLRSLKTSPARYLRALLLVMTAYLYIYNICLFASYLLG
jgi:hypothetical protein